jgi:hypothetical protein
MPKMSLAEAPRIYTSRISQKIKSQNYALVDSPLPKVDLVEAAESFIEFLGMEEEKKKKFSLEEDEENEKKDGSSEIGYIRRFKGKGGKFDNKEFFHYNDYARVRFAGLASIDKRAEEFLFKAYRVFGATKNRVKGVLSELEEEYPGISGRFFKDGVHPNLFLRFLAYDYEDSPSVKRDLGVGHYDKGALTLALAESGPGLYMGATKFDTKPVPYHPEKSMLFRGLQEVPELSDDLQPAWHGVRQKIGKEYSPGIARWSMVCFIDLLGENLITTLQAHTSR